MRFAFSQGRDDAFQERTDDCRAADPGVLLGELAGLDTFLDQPGERFCQAGAGLQAYLADLS